MKRVRCKLEMLKGPLSSPPPCGWRRPTTKYHPLGPSSHRYFHLPARSTLQLQQSGSRRPPWRMTPCGESFRTTSTAATSGPSVGDELNSKENIDKFLQALSDDQKRLIYQSLHVAVLRDKYMNELASESHYLSKFGRPAASTPRWGHEDPSGTLADLSQKWLRSRSEGGPAEEPLASSGAVTDSVQPTPVIASDLFAVGLKNALPFIGFGFLDNLIMILAGDYIDLTIGAALGISTMAAAALGNTISDVAGIASAWYVEHFAERIGIHGPDLTAAQQASWSVRWASNMGRAIGVIIGCLLGMAPLAFLHTSEEDGVKAAGEPPSAKSQKTTNNEVKGREEHV